jgi:hypothetical protein
MAWMRYTTDSVEVMLNASSDALRTLPATATPDEVAAAFDEVVASETATED